MKHIILKAIELSALAYKGIEEVKKHLADYKGFSEVLTICNNLTDTQGFIYDPGDVVWIVIRGTELTSLNDWLTNMDCRFEEGPWGDAHTGFQLDMLSISTQAFYAVQRAKRDNKRVVITGHSQGAAVAEQLFGYVAARTEVDHVTCISVEPPKSFSTTAAENFGWNYGKQIHQVIHNNDIVPMLPPSGLGFRHVSNATVWYINRKGKVRVGVPWWKRLKDRFLGLCGDVFDTDLDCIADHDVEEIARIWKNQM